MVYCQCFVATDAERLGLKNWCTATLSNRIMTVQCEGMGEVGSARYEPALLPPCPSIRVLSYSNCQEIHSRQADGPGSVSVKDFFVRWTMAPEARLTQCKKATIHQLTTMLATSKDVLFPSPNHLLTTSADDLTLKLSSKHQQGWQLKWTTSFSKLWLYFYIDTQIAQVAQASQLILIGQLRQSEQQ